MILLQLKVNYKLIKHFKPAKMGNSSLQSEKDAYQQMLKAYSMVKSSHNQMISYLQHKSTRQQYLLREFNFSDQEIYLTRLSLLKKKSEILINSQHTVKIQKVIQQKNEQYCMTLYKVYVLLEYPHRTLAHQIEERKRRNLRFEEKDIWSILAGAILGFSHLQKHQIKHSSLTANSVLFTSDGLIKIFDPDIVGSKSNLLTIYQERSAKNVYISPQQLAAINQDETNVQYNTFKSDIWVLGLIILQVSLLKSMMECYREEYSNISWQTVNFNIKLFQNEYSSELSNFLQLMLIKDHEERPDFLQLEKVMTSEEESNKSCMLNEVKSYEDIFIDSKCTQNKKTQHSIMPTQTFLSERPAQIYNPLFSIDQSLIKTNPKENSIHQSIIFIPSVSVSNISQSRPFRSLFPVNAYKTNTCIDEYLQKIDVSKDYTERPEERRQKHNGELVNHFTKTQNYNSLNIIYETNSKEELVINEKPSMNLNKSQINQSNQGNTSRSSSQKKSSEYIMESYKQGSRYEGYKLNNMKHGFGTFYYPEGGRYQGDWFMDKMQGKGKLYYESGKLAYQGQWSNDTFTGKGVLYNDSPQIFRNLFDFVNFDEIQEYWTKYEGQFSADMKNGLGKLYLTNGEIFQGHFQDDFIHGEGIYYTQNGRTIKGTWHTNLML